MICLLSFTCTKIFFIFLLVWFPWYTLSYDYSYYYHYDYQCSCDCMGQGDCETDNIPRTDSYDLPKEELGACKRVLGCQNPGSMFTIDSTSDCMLFSGCCWKSSTLLAYPFYTYSLECATGPNMWCNMGGRGCYSAVNCVCTAVDESNGNIQTTPHDGNDQDITSTPVERHNQPATNNPYTTSFQGIPNSTRNRNEQNTALSPNDQTTTPNSRNTNDHDISSSPRNGNELTTPNKDDVVERTKNPEGNTGKNNELSIGIKIGVGIGVGIMLLFLVVIGLLLFCHRQGHKAGLAQGRKEVQNQQTLNSGNNLGDYAEIADGSPPFTAIVNQNYNMDVIHGNKQSNQEYTTLNKSDSSTTNSQYQALENLNEDLEKNDYIDPEKYTELKTATKVNSDVNDEDGNGKEKDDEEEYVKPENDTREYFTLEPSAPLSTKPDG